MRVAIVSTEGSLAAYTNELLKTWGVAFAECIDPADVAALDVAGTPVLILPSGAPEGGAAGYAERGGTVLAFAPSAELAAAAGLRIEGPKETPLRFRLTDFVSPGLAGDLMPVVGPALSYAADEAVRARGYLSVPGRFHGETVGMTESRAGAGRIVAFAFDLPLCVMMLRQGDPALSEVLPEWDGCARPSHLACHLGGQDCGWAPFADLLARVLVEAVLRALPAPAPLVSPMPAQAPAMLVYSGDEDNGEVSWNNEEFDYLADADGRMSLYLIPHTTQSTPADVGHYRERNDVGPHPDIRALDGAPVAERAAEYERQIRLFGSKFGLQPRTIRNHCTAWFGYMEPIEVQERCGIRMDVNYFSGGYARNRDSSPYSSFGGGLPVRFCRPDGRLIEVFQQHSQLADDIMFAPDADYSYKFSPAQFEVYLRRAFGDMATRFHTAMCVCIHPPSWVRFAGKPGRELIRQAGEFGMPVWSTDQWCDFWEARDSWRVEDLTWDGRRLGFTVEGAIPHADIRVTLPTRSGPTALQGIDVDGARIAVNTVVRHGEEVALVELPAESRRVAVGAHYA